MASACEFPEELLSKPLGYVALTGLDLQYNAMHKSIWDAFSNRRQEKVLNIKVLAPETEFPAKKLKQRTSYEFYIPKGILKRNWISKHIHHLPALVVIFYDLDWNDPNWKEKQTECASKVAAIKLALQGRSTKIAVVLIQKNTPPPPGEDPPQATQRAQALSQACDFQSNSLFVLPFGDNLLGYITRLEGAFYEILQNFYSEEAKFVKQHKELLNKSQHQLLYIRHQFKVAFYSELKQDIQLALKHYKQAYQYVLEVKLTVVNNLEVKLVAGFLNYKICRISFNLNAPLDAISQFRKHIDYFKQSSGSNQLLFEHCAWMAKQFSLFGDLFQDAIKGGLQAIQTQHPGFYYQQAANFTKMRMRHCKLLCKAFESANPATYLDRNNLEFYGQRAWRPYCQANEAPDPSMEHIGVQLLQSEELNVEHYWIIIPLLSSAVTQFREYKSVRMKLYLMVQMGEEYFNAKDYTKALTLFTRVMPYYRGERWWKLLTRVLTIALRCAYLTASLQDYIAISLELIGKHCVIENDEKTRIQMNLQRVVKRNLPEPEPSCDESSVESAKALWLNIQQNDPKEICYIDMENLASFVEVRGAFNEDTYYIDQVVSVGIYLRSDGAYPIQFTELGLSFSNPFYNTKCVKNGRDIETSGGSSDLYLESGKVQHHVFDFVLSPQDISKKLEIKQIYLLLGESTILRWKGAGLDANISPSFDSSNYGGDRRPIKYNADGNILWNTVTISPFTDVLPREGAVELSVSHNSPSLLDEFYPITILIHNKEDTTITNTKLIVKLENSEAQEKQKATLYLDETDGGDNLSGLNQVEFDFEDLSANAQITKIINLKSMEIGMKSVVFKISYNIDVMVGEEQIVTNCICQKEENINVDTVLPFSMSVKVANMMFKQVERVYMDQPFSFATYIKCTSPWPLQLVSTELLLSNDFKRVDEKYISHVAGINIKEGEIATECHCLVAQSTRGAQYATSTELNIAERSIFMGSYILHWKRLNGDIVAQSKINLPMTTVEFAPLKVTADVPPLGCLDKQMVCRYAVVNLTHLVQEVEIGVEASESFMLSGNSQIQVRILPYSDHKIMFSLYPLHCGELPLPKLHINLPQHHTFKMDFLSQQHLPTHVFIKPKTISRQNNTVVEVS